MHTFARSWRWLSLVVAVGSIAAGSTTHRVSIEVEAKKIAVLVDGALFTALHADTDARKLYLHPLTSSSGRRVTRSFPMETISGESTDHPHQRGVWIGTEDLSGLDFWENERSYDRPNQGTIALTGVSDVRSGNGEGRFTIAANWVAPNGDVKIVETRTMIFRALGDDRSIDVDLRLAAKAAVRFADNHDAILGLRLGTEFEEAHGGRAVNAEGIRGWERLRGSRSAWVDWHAVVDGENVGVAVMDHPSNFRFPTPWHVRDYALLFASPFASRDYSPTAPDGSVALKPGGELRLRYRILVHAADVDVTSAFREFAGQ